MAQRRLLTSTQVYLTRETIARLRRIADERGIPAAAIIRSGIESALDEVEATPDGFMPARVRRHLRPTRPGNKQLMEQSERSSETKT
jgi:predicted DNA-binding protein